MRHQASVRLSALWCLAHWPLSNQHDVCWWPWCISLLWRHNGRDGVSNHQPHDCLLNRLFKHRSKKTSKLRVTGLCVRGEFTGDRWIPRTKGSNAKKVFIWWLHHVCDKTSTSTMLTILRKVFTWNLDFLLSRLNYFAFSLCVTF